MKFWEINNAVKDEMRLDPGLVTDIERVRFFNDCLDGIADLQLLESTSEDTNVSDQYPTLPTGLEKVRKLYWNNSTLTRLQSDKDMDSSGQPVGYILEGDRIRLWPKPASAGTLRWTYTGSSPYCTEDDVTNVASNVEPSIPSSWHTLLVDYACYRSHRKNGNVLMASQYKKDYDSSLSSNVRAYVSKLNSQVVEALAPESYGGDFYGY